MGGVGGWGGAVRDCLWIVQETSSLSNGMLHNCWEVILEKDTYLKTQSAPGSKRSRIQDPGSKRSRIPDPHQRIFSKLSEI